jgi:hypothetical protein
MVRTVVSLEAVDKAWLDRKAAQEKISMAELIRRAIRLYQRQSEVGTQPIQQLLEATSGIWQGDDGLTYQRRMREEWERTS